MKTLVSRAALAALLATSLSAGFVSAASAQVSPADPNYSYDTRGKTVPWGGVHNAGAAFAQAPAVRTHVRNAAPGRDADASIQQPSFSSEGLFDR